jgi:hypothetical protein
MRGGALDLEGMFSVAREPGTAPGTSISPVAQLWNG